MNLDIFFNMRKIKYEILKPMVEGILGPEVKHISCYINLNSILESLYKQNVLENLEIGNNKYTMTSQLMNLIAHYRHYFWSRYGIITTFYIDYSDQKSTYHLNLDSEYKKDYYAKQTSQEGKFLAVNSMIKKNIRIIELLTQYIPYVYFINTLDTEPSAIPYYLITTDNVENNINIILTENELDYQLLELDNTYILKLNGKNSKLINRYNVLNDLTKKKEEKYIINQGLLSLILSIKTNKYNAESIKGFGYIKIINLINKLLNNKEIINIKYKNIEEISKLIDEKNYKLIEKKFKLFDYETSTRFLSIKHKELIDDSMVDKEDNYNLKRINDTYFIKEPLMLIELTEGF